MSTDKIALLKSDDERPWERARLKDRGIHQMGKRRGERSQRKWSKKTSWSRDLQTIEAKLEIYFNYGEATTRLVSRKVNEIGSMVEKP